MDYRPPNSFRNSHLRTQVLRLPPTTWTSLYIPYLDSSYDRDDIIDLFEHKYFVGIVSRVDIVKTRPKTTGFINSKECVSAFVHFECWYDNEFTYFLRDYLEKYEKYNMREYMEFVPPTRRKFQPDNFQVLINQSASVSRNGYSYARPFEPKSYRPVAEHAMVTKSESPTNKYSETMHKQQKRIELLEEEINILRDLMSDVISGSSGRT